MERKGWALGAQITGRVSSRGGRRRHTPGGKAQAGPWTLPGRAAHSEPRQHWALGQCS